MSLASHILNERPTSALETMRGVFHAHLLYDYSIKHFGDVVYASHSTPCVCMLCRFYSVLNFILLLGLLRWVTIMQPFDSANMTRTRAHSIPLWASFRWRISDHLSGAVQLVIGWTVNQYVHTVPNNLLSFTISSQVFCPQNICSYVIHPSRVYSESWLRVPVSERNLRLCVFIVSRYRPDRKWQSKIPAYTEYNCHPSTRWAFRLNQYWWSNADIQIAIGIGMLTCGIWQIFMLMLALSWSWPCHRVCLLHYIFICNLS